MTKAFRPTPEQLEAANPSHSAWVTANAGSGKTHVLVERVIRLLLEGAEPASILCITFTKAAAAEMSSRLFDKLSAWTALDRDELSHELERMGVRDFTAAHLIDARRLFTRVLETPGGLKIQTIHAFCERVLQLFPVEAGIAPGFRVLDDRSATDMRDEAQRAVLQEAELGTDPELSKAFQSVVANSNGDSETFDSLIRSFLSASKNLRALLTTEDNGSAFAQKLKAASNVPQHDIEAEVVKDINAIDEANYRFHASVLAAHKIYSKHDAAQMLNKAAASHDRTNVLKLLFFTKDKQLKPRDKLMAKAVSDANPATEEFVRAEQTRLTALFNRQDLLKRIAATSSLFVLAKAIFQRVEYLKRRQGLYDFDDLIRRTRQLLQNARATQWVLYKLDSGLQHILLDEAQDTSPAQWQIFHALAEEFFSGEGRPQAGPRTLFVVGDRKQSIYSFQGADAGTFAQAREQFTKYIERAQKAQSQIELNISYRSSPEILDAVNKVFPASNRTLLGFNTDDAGEHDHTSNRSGEPGLVEVWPLVEPLEEADKDDHWDAPIDRETMQSSRRRLARMIALTIKSWIGKRHLASQNRAVEPGDILLLLQSRGALFSMLIAELRKAGVPVAGADRLKLRESLAVQDLLALVQWLLLPQDDHALACILKSPFVPEPLDEVGLFDLANDRGSHTLWSRLEQTQSATAAWLFKLIKTAQGSGPFQFFARILVTYRKAMLARLGPEAGDATDALLDHARGYEAEHGQSLAGFLHWFTATEIEIKRELERSSGEVRLMTVHGAKGLEANIVFLPDAATIPQGHAAGRLLMLPETGTTESLPLWMVSGLSLNQDLQTWTDDAKQKLTQERNRLLYVAMTRARDELYICGAKGKTKNLPKDCWYEIVEPILGVTAPKNVSASSSPHSESVSMSSKEIPSWAKTPAAAESNRPEVSLTGLIKHQTSSRNSPEMKRGTAIHTLLQSLADHPADSRPARAKWLAGRLSLSPQEALSLVEILNLPELQQFLGPDSQAEVELSGVLDNGMQVAGRIDRLVQKPDEILVLDYKTDRLVHDALPFDDPYIQQMALYALLLSQAYPDLEVKTAIFWTQMAKLQWIDAEILKQAQNQFQANLVKAVS